MFFEHFRFLTFCIISITHSLYFLVIFVFFWFCFFCTFILIYINTCRSLTRVGLLHVLVSYTCRSLSWLGYIYGRAPDKTIAREYASKVFSFAHIQGSATLRWWRWRTVNATRGGMVSMLSKPRIQRKPSNHSLIWCWTVTAVPWLWYATRKPIPPIHWFINLLTY